MKVNEWTPVGVERLEKSADDAVRHLGSLSVIAGPGAGKTELLAQRALFLLQTNSCNRPQKILSLCFKKDAARNLKDRVAKRSDEFGHRFESLTFDAFAKSIVDRFYMGLPDEWAVSPDYSIESMNFQRYIALMKSSTIPAEFVDVSDIHWLNKDQFADFYKQVLYGKRLASQRGDQSNAVRWLTSILLESMLSCLPQKLDFPLICRLADLILTSNPKILRALRLTYSDVFLDEFQDTTHVQFDLIKTAFGDSPVRLTAVGDNKQRIMGWAMALPNAFAEFGQYFGGPTIPLTMNYRSSKNLVNIQAFFAQVLDPNFVPQKAYDQAIKGECLTLIFPDEKTEAQNVALKIKSLINKELVPARDIAVLVKMKPLAYTAALTKALSFHGIASRIEDAYQDLLKEEIVEFCLNILTICAKARAEDAWLEALEFIKEIFGADDAVSLRQVERELSIFCLKLRKKLATANIESTFRAILDEIIEHIGIDKVKASFPTFSNSIYLDKFLTNFSVLFCKSFVACGNALELAVPHFKGVNCLPIMTIHKSKGLEYDTVFFVGLEDGAFWNFRMQKTEDTSAFFVALSRAKSRMFFTFCKTRSPNGYSENQARSSINELFDLLKTAGVPEKEIGFVSK